MARPLEHQLVATEVDEAELVCATLLYDGGANNPLTLALPDYIVKPLRELPGLTGNLDWLLKKPSATNAAAMSSSIVCSNLWRFSGFATSSRAAALRRG